MTRVASLLVIAAMAMLVSMARDTNGHTAIGFSFVGLPLVGAAIVVYGFQRWREGAFSERSRSDRDRTAREE